MGMMDSLFGGSSSTTNPSFIDKNQAGYLQSLWGAGGQMQGQDMSGLQGQLGGLFQQGQGMQQNLQNNPFLGGQYNPSQAATGQIGALGDLLNQQAGRLAHSVGQTGVQAGQFGQSRGEVGRGLIGEGSQQALSQGAGQIMGQDMRNQLGQAGIYAQSQLGGLNALQGQGQMAQQGAMSPWLPLMAQQGLLGSPAIVGGGGTTSQTGGIVPGISGLMGGYGSFLSGLGSFT